MKLLLDGSGGFAGDMFTAALLNSGANYNNVRHNMVTCGKKLGDIKIDHKKNMDGSTQLMITLHPNSDHVEAGSIKKLLLECFEKLNIGKIYREFGEKVLNILIDAENEAHKSHVFDKLMHDHGHTHKGTVLHEAQDILIDIIGAVSGLELMKVEPSASLIKPVRTGYGMIEFSHGILDVPAPATKIILNKFNIDWRKGPIEAELCTPTGASLLAALTGNNDDNNKEVDFKVLYEGSSRGSKILPIPPLKIFLI